MEPTSWSTRRISRKLWASFLEEGGRRMLPRWTVGKSMEQSLKRETRSPTQLELKTKASRTRGQAAQVSQGTIFSLKKFSKEREGASLVTRNPSEAGSQR